MKSITESKKLQIGEKKMKLKRITSLLLTVLMLVGSVITAIPASAEELVIADFDHLTTVFANAEERIAKMQLYSPVSYTHLTLPTKA